ncbi:MAG: protoporphyrinogen oxidase, partial [Bryobacteraceae bacterium]
MSRVVIVGGGISGISTAYYLSRRGIPATLVEKQDRLGGVIHTETVHGCVIESGPDSFIAIKPWALDLINELGLSGEVIGSNDHLRVTYLLRHGRLLPLPDGLMLMVPTKLGPMISTRLLGWPTKIHMGLEMLRKPPRTPMPDRSVADFIRDHYGQETVDYLAEPLLAGVYGGDPEALSVRSVLTR